MPSSNNYIWLLMHNIIYDVSKSKSFYDIAAEFLKSAYKDLQEQRFRPFVESLSIAAENLARARIYLLPDKEIRKIRKHGGIQSRVNIYARTDSVIKTGQKDAFNNLMKLRDNARYNPSFSLNREDADNLFNQIKN